MHAGYWLMCGVIVVDVESFWSTCHGHDAYIHDHANTNNNDFLSTPIASLNDVESCEINVALLDLVLKDQFFGLPSEDAATHLNNFVDLCEMQKKKDTDNDIVKLKLFPFFT